VKAAALGNTALKTGSDCSFTTRKLRVLACFCLVLPSFATFSHSLERRTLYSVKARHGVASVDAPACGNNPVITPFITLFAPVLAFFTSCLDWPGSCRGALL
jgi:hypothetical protein